MDKRVLILHGWQNTRPSGHWQYWLAEQLRREGTLVAYPQLPNPDHPDLDTWLGVLDKELEMLGTGERVVICHSLSCLLWLHAAQRQLNVGAATRVLFVAPPGAEAFTSDIASFAPIDFAPDRVAESSRQQIRLAYAIDDPYCVDGAERSYGVPLGLDCDVIADGGHLSTNDGYGPWPHALEWVRDEATRFR